MFPLIPRALERFVLLQSRHSSAYCTTTSCRARERRGPGYLGNQGAEFCHLVLSTAIWRLHSRRASEPSHCASRVRGACFIQAVLVELLFNSTVQASRLSRRSEGRRIVLSSWGTILHGYSRFFCCNFHCGGLRHSPSLLSGLQSSHALLGS